MTRRASEMNPIDVAEVTLMPPSSGEDARVDCRLCGETYLLLAQREPGPLCDACAQEAAQVLAEYVQKLVVDRRAGQLPAWQSDDADGQARPLPMSRGRRRK